MATFQAPCDTGTCRLLYSQLSRKWRMVIMLKMRTGSARKVSHLPEATQPDVPAQGFFEMINVWVILSAHRHTPLAQCHSLQTDSSQTSADGFIHCEQISGRCRSGKGKGRMAFGAAPPGSPGLQRAGTLGGRGSAPADDSSCSAQLHTLCTKPSSPPGQQVR